MNVLICAGDITQAAEIRDAIERIMGKNRVPLGIYSQLSIFLAQTQTGSRTEIRIYLMPEMESLRRTRGVESLRTEITEKLSLADSQVICATKFP